MQFRYFGPGEVDVASHIDITCDHGGVDAIAGQDKEGHGLLQ